MDDKYLWVVGEGAVLVWQVLSGAGTGPWVLALALQ